MEEGIGKTSLAVHLIPKPGVKRENIILLDAARADQAVGPVQDLWEQMSDQLQRGFPALLQWVLEAHKKAQDPLVLFKALSPGISKPWMIYLDNAISLQIKVELTERALGERKTPGIETWWHIAMITPIRSCNGLTAKRGP